MSTPGVEQTPQLNRIVARQLSDYKPSSLLYLGVAGGNGLEHVDLGRTRRLTAVDVNAEYLRVCGERHARLRGILRLLERDLTQGEATLPAADLVIANLLVEYVGAARFAEFAQVNRARWRAISCVLQRDNGENFVSRSAHAAKLSKALRGATHVVEENAFCDALEVVGWRQSRREVYALPNGKDFLRLDFCA